MKILSFDIEDWFHLLNLRSVESPKQWEEFPSRIEANTERILHLLEERKVRATFFCLGWIAKKYPKIIRRISDAGYEIASHSHLHQLAYHQTRKEFKQDLVTSIKLLQDISGKKVRAYRAPGFSLKEENKWVFEILIENGIEFDCSIFPSKRSHGGFKKFGIVTPCIVDVSGYRLKEFPINIRNYGSLHLIFSGGGYFRFFPKNLIHRWMHKSDYVMTYFHPRDFDPQQPMLPGLNPFRKFKSYYGLEGCYQKLDDTLAKFRFIDLDEADKTINWDEMPIKYL